MKKYDSQYYFLEQVNRLPPLVADENTEDRTYSYEAACRHTAFLYIMTLNLAFSPWLTWSVF